MGAPGKEGPELAAIMCDGAGWFSERDYKRMLLVFSEILYLLPSRTVEFQDVTGRTEQLSFLHVTSGPQSLFRVVHFLPSTAEAQAILLTASEEARDKNFQDAIASVPSSDALYTWRVANTDGDLTGESIGLAPTDVAAAHSILLTKFLLAADEYQCTPISGRRHFSPLLAAKCLRSSATAGRTASLPQLVNGLVSTIVPDDELDRRTSEQIIDYKARNIDLFREFWLVVRKLAAGLQEAPGTPGAALELQDLLRVDVWKAKAEIEAELSAAWGKFFGSATKALAGGALAAALIPFVGLTSLSVGALLGATGTAGPWLAGELVDLLQRRRAAQKHGLCYLLGVGGAG